MKIGYRKLVNCKTERFQVARSRDYCPLSRREKRLKRGKFLLCGMLFILSQSTFAQFSGTWQVKGADAIVGLSTNPQNPDHGKNAFLIIGYSKKFDCKPVASVLVIEGQVLGRPIEQKNSKSAKNQLIVSVGGREFTDQTKFTTYTNGMELAMKVPERLLDALDNPHTQVSARIGATTIVSLESAKNFYSANRSARMACK